MKTQRDGPTTCAQALYRVLYHPILCRNSKDPRTHQHCLQRWDRAGWWVLLESGRSAFAQWALTTHLSSKDKHKYGYNYKYTYRLGIVVGKREKTSLLVLTHPSHALSCLAQLSYCIVLFCIELYCFLFFAMSCSAFQSLEPSHIQPDTDLQRIELLSFFLRFASF